MPSVSILFSPLELGPLKLANRIVVAPMCQYSASEGSASDWHMMHLGQLSLSGAGLMILEASAVEARGRITYGDLGLYSDANETALARVIAAIRRYSPIPVGIQLAHAGRKASTQKPWDGGGAIAPDAKNGWPIISASSLPFHEGDPAPVAMQRGDIDDLIDAFVASAKRAERLGLDLIELHAAHGYLLHQFLSPLSNQRTDDYGGSLENRMRLTLQVFEAVREAMPASMSVGIRISASDWVEGGWDLKQSIELAKALDARGCSYIHVSSGGLSPAQKIAIGPGYQVHFAQGIKAAVKMPVIAVGMITEPDQAEAIIAEGKADAVALARGMLYDPRWPWHAAAKLGAKVHAPP
ncbi:NADH:flavin oxidoreductase/NADH oxidase, partial [Oleiagrimonas sp.]|uniref:NADH:flavin oxidoreductase/NADH oxidase n=1 Tax=Oleiagrimonas sp. TaxID=2010330 RepID=UPI002603112D